MPTTRPPRSLDELRDLLNAAPTEKDGPQQSDYARAHGLPTAHGEIDMTSLPTFGGVVPSDTLGVWSWDETRLLIGDGRPVYLVPRVDG